MNYHTISDLVAEYLEGSLVTAAFFSTYSFEPDFFELEIMPLLMSQQVGNSNKTYLPALSTNDAIRWQQLERLMAERQVATSVVYDPSVYKCERSPRLEIAYHGYSPSFGCQHAKLIAIVLETPEIETSEKKLPQVLFGAGSFNLTRAGWWDNIECGHFVKLSDRWAPRNLCEAITKALVFYQQQAGNHDTALQKVLGVIDALPKSEDNEKLDFYFSGSLNEQAQNSFSDFITQYHEYDQLEVITPYFAESGSNKVISKFLKQFKSRKILLPLDPRDNTRAKIEKSVFNELKEHEVCWCSWQTDVESKLKDSSSPRELHAKVYQMSNQNTVDLFIGSVNFSYKAFQDNIEAGFLLRDIKEDNLLSDTINIEPFCFESVQGDVHGDKQDESGRLPVLNLCYCWKNQILKLERDDISWDSKIELVNSSDEKLATLNVLNGCVLKEATIDKKLIEQHLKNTSLLTAKSFCNGVLKSSDIIISQINICVRPSILPPLSLVDLLSIFRGMSKPRLLLLTEHYAKLSELSLAYQSGDDIAVELKSASRNFFSEFSEINSAFYYLNEKLNQAKNENDQRVLNYYLYGKQPDSLYGAFQLLTGDEKDSGEESIEPVIRYLSLLSIQDTLQRVENSNKALFKNVCKAVERIESSNILSLTDGASPEYNQQFFVWFKQEFLSNAQLN